MAKSSNTPLLLGGLGLAALYFFRRKASTSNGPPAADAAIAAALLAAQNDAALLAARNAAAAALLAAQNAAALLAAQNGGRNTTGGGSNAHTPSGQQPGGGPNPPPVVTPRPIPPGTPVDKFGTPHRTMTGRDLRNQRGTDLDYQGLVQFALWQRNGLYAEDSEFLIQKDSDTSHGGNTAPTYNWLGENITNIMALLNAYGDDMRTYIATLASGNTGAGNANTVLIDRFGMKHRSASTIAFANGFDDFKGNLYKDLSLRFGLFMEDVEAMMVWEHNRSGNSFAQVFQWFFDDNGRLAGYFADYNRDNPSAPIVPRR